MNKYIKLLIGGLLIIFSFYLIFIKNIFFAIILFIISIIPIFLFFRNEYILLAFWFLRKKNIRKANFFLTKIFNIKKQLHRNQYGYYNYLNGICEAYNNPEKSGNFMKKALKFGLTFDHDKAIAYLNLSASLLTLGKKTESEKYLAKAKEYDKSNLLIDQIKIIKEQSKKNNINKNLQNPQYRSKKKYF